MVSKGKKYPKHYVKRRKQRLVINQKSTPTENDSRLIDDENTNKYIEYDSLKTSRVPVEDSTLNRVGTFLKELGAVLASIVIFVAVIFWAARIEFKVEETEINLKEQESSINTLTTKVQDLNIYRSGLEKDILYLKESKQFTEQKIISIQNRIDSRLERVKTKKANN